MAERLVYTLEVWVAAIGGEPVPPPARGPLQPRFERAALGFERLAKSIRDRGAFDDAFVDALCEPPQSFTYGGVIAHVLTFGAIRREALALRAGRARRGAAGDERPDPVGGSELADPDGPERDDVLSAAVRLQADVAAAAGVTPCSG